MKIFFLLFHFSFLLNAAISFQISFSPRDNGFEINGTRIENTSPSLDPYLHLKEGKPRLEKLIKEIKDSQNNEQRVNLLLLENYNNPYGFLRECDNSSCLLTRTAQFGHRDRFLNDIRDKFFSQLKFISQKIIPEGINIVFYESKGLLFEAKIIEAMMESGIKINTISIIDKKYADINEVINKNSTFSFNLASTPFLDVKGSAEPFADLRAEFLEHDIQGTPVPVILVLAYKRLQPSADIELRFKLMQLMQFRNYITKYNQSPRVLIFDSEEAFSNSKIETHFLSSVDLLEPQILANPEGSSKLTQSLLKLFFNSLFGAMLWNDAGHINTVERIYDFKTQKTDTVTIRYN